MSSSQTRYSLRSSARRTAQAAQGTHDSEEDGDYLLDDEVADKIVDDDGIEEMPETSGTPTPLPRPDPTTGAQSPPQPGADSANDDDDDEAPAPSRPVRRCLFPDARPSGAISRPFSPLRPAPGGGALLPAPTAAAQGTFAPAYPASFAPPWRAIPAPVSFLAGAPGGRGGGGGNPSLIDPRLLAWVEASSGSVVEAGVGGGRSSGSSGGGGGAVGAGGLVLSRHSNSTNAGGQGNAGFARQENFVQWTNPVPESPFVLAQGMGRYGPFAGQRPILRPLVNAVPALPLPSNGYVESRAIDPANPYASFLRANSVALAQGHGAVTGQDLRGGSRAVSTAVTVSMGPARTGRAWEGVPAHTLRHPAYPPGFPHPADAATAATAAIRPSANAAGTSSSLSVANQRATSSSSAAAAMHPNASSFNFGNQPEFAFAFPTAAHPSGDPAAFHSGNSAAFPSGAFPDAFPVALPNSFPNAFLGSASELHDPFIDQSHPTSSTAFPVASQQPPLPQTAQDSTMVLRRMDPAVARQSVENAQSVEYQLLQLKVRNRADADRAQNMNAPNNLLTRNAQINDNGYASLEFQMPNQAENDMDNLSTVANADSDSDAPKVAATDNENADEHEGTDEEDSNNGAGCNDNNNNIEVISDSDDLDDDPIPHVPAVSPMHVYNPHHNPAAAYWVALPPPPVMDEYTLLNKPPPSINMYSTPPLPTFDTDPFLPFAPWRVGQLPPFHPEPTNRVITIPARYLPAIGQLYPDATFLISRHPASENFTTRIKGRALATSMALHFPHLLNPALSDVEEENSTMYILALTQRDWPIGGVASLPNTPAAEAFVTELREAFDVLPNGQEAFYYLPHDIRLQSGKDGKGKGMWVCRAYEGRQGPQDERIVMEWLKSQGGGDIGGGVVEEDEMGREVLVRMGEAWVEPERWPRVAAGGKGRKKNKKVKVTVEDGEEEE